MIVFGDPAASLITALLVSGFGALIGAIIYGLMAHPATRREPFSSFGSYSKRTSAIVGLVIAALFSAGGYWIYLTPFFFAEPDGDRLVLEHRFPSRTVRLAREEIARIERRSVVSRSGTKYRCLILTRSGKIYESAETGPDVFKSSLERLMLWHAPDKIGQR